MGDRIAIMKEGGLAQVGTPTEILTNPADEYVRSFVQNVDRTKVIPVRTVMRDPREEETPGLGDAPSVAPHTSIAEALPHVLDADGPIAVRNRAGEVQGVVSRSAVLDEVARNAEHVMETREAAREAKEAEAA
jgi:glycine betaine/proline transport system ATP-binding protein